MIDTQLPELDQLASLARTALTDPDALDESVYPNVRDREVAAVWPPGTDAATIYAVGRMDELIALLNPPEMTLEGAARALTVLGRHIDDVRQRLVAECDVEEKRSALDASLEDAGDALDLAIAFLSEEPVDG